MSSFRLPTSFSGDYDLQSIVGSTGIFPNREYTLDGIFYDKYGEYAYHDAKSGDILYDADWKKYEVQQFNPSTGPLYLRKLIVREKPEGNTGLTGTSPTMGTGMLVRQNTFSDLVAWSHEPNVINQKYYDNFMGATDNCSIPAGTRRAAILCSQNMTNQVDESLMVNEICNMRSNIISDENLKKQIAECPAVTGIDQFTKFLATKTYEFKFKDDDSSAPMRRGFIAQRMQEQFPSAVLTTFQRKYPVKKSGDQWLDEDDNVVDTETHTITVDSDHPDRGSYFTTENRDHICIDSTALLEVMWVTMQELINENTSLKSRVTVLEGHH